MKPPMYCNVCGDTKCSSCGATKGRFTHIYYGEDVCDACTGFLAQDATIAERKRIIALARAKVVEFERNLTHRGDPYDDGYHDGIQEFANELEAECE